MTYLASALEILGASLILYAVWTWAPAVAIALLGLGLISTGYSLGRSK